MERNTAEAPKLERCDTCGATRLDGHGKVTLVRGVLQCRDCAAGAAELVAEEPDVWEFGPDGRLRRITPDPQAEVARARVTELHAAVTAALHGIAGVTVEVFHPLSGVAVVLPGGYRWHVYVPGEGVVLDPEHSSVMLFGPDPERAMVTSVAPGVLPDTVADIRLVVQASTDPEHPLCQALDADAVQRIGIASFDPDELLRGN